jgi:hypothetical protein
MNTINKYSILIYTTYHCSVCITDYIIHVVARGNAVAMLYMYVNAKIKYHDGPHAEQYGQQLLFAPWEKFLTIHTYIVPYLLSWGYALFVACCRPIFGFEHSDMHTLNTLDSCQLVNWKAWYMIKKTSIAIKMNYLAWLVLAVLQKSHETDA